MTSLMMRLLGAVILTIGIESLVLTPIFLPYASNRRKLILNVILINVITNITLNLILVVVDFRILETKMLHRMRWFLILLGELLIPLLEAFLYEQGDLQIGRKRVIETCYLANALSFGVGAVGGMIW